jgi:transporter family-2 protein
MNSTIFYGALATLAGVLIPIMAALSGAMGRTFNSPMAASLVVIVGAFVLALAFGLATGGLNVSWNTLQQARPIELAAGIGFVFYIASMTWLAPRFGIGNAVMFVLFGQIISSALIDQFGLFGAPQKPIDLLRAMGLVVMAAGIVIAQIAANDAKPTS